jgi:23S rRNA pseudouridine2457 synthase
MLLASFWRLFRLFLRGRRGKTARKKHPTTRHDDARSNLSGGQEHITKPSNENDFRFGMIQKALSKRTSTAKNMLIALHKPWGVLSQFTAEVPQHRTLAEFHLPSSVYPIGRLDRDSEGLLLLSDEKLLVDRLLNPRYAHPRTYTVQVENIVTNTALRRLEQGVRIEDKMTRPCRAWRLMPHNDVDDDNVDNNADADAFVPSSSSSIIWSPPPPRINGPAVRYRQHIPTDWIAIQLIEGRNRQVRKMTAHIGHPTLRLLRTGIGNFVLDFNTLPSGTWKELSPTERALVLSSSTTKTTTPTRIIDDYDDGPN